MTTYATVVFKQPVLPVTGERLVGAPVLKHRCTHLIEMCHV